MIILYLERNKHTSNLRTKNDADGYSLSDSNRKYNMLLSDDLEQQLLVDKPKHSAVIFVDVNDVCPTQVMYSSRNAQEKYLKAIKRRDQMAPVLSLYSSDKAIPVIGFNAKYYAIDGHHSVVATTLGGFTLIPVTMVDIYHGAEHEFWSWMEQMNYAYLYDHQGAPTPPVKSFYEMTDEPLRYFVARSAKKYDSTLDSSKSSGPHHPLWIKIDKSVPFIEFKIAVLLHQLGFKYNYEDDIDVKIEQARAILNANVSTIPLISEFSFILDPSKDQPKVEPVDHSTAKAYLKLG